MAQPTVELPNMPDDWLDDPASAPVSGVVKIPPPSGDSPAPGILGGLPMPPDWSLENSGINAFVDPQTMKTIDFTGDAPPETPPWLKTENAAPGGQSQPPQPSAASSSSLDYDGATHQLTVIGGDGTVQTFPANNNVDSRAHMTHRPNGTFSYDQLHAHPDDGPDSAYGSYGGYGFNVPGHQNLEVHSGRIDHTDGLGRSGVNYPTFGCIRTTDDGVAAIRDAVASGYPLQSLTVRNNN